jgi:hypothetical protein
MFLRNIGWLAAAYTPLYTRREYSSIFKYWNLIIKLWGRVGKWSCISANHNIGTRLSRRLPPPPPQLYRSRRGSYEEEKLISSLLRLGHVVAQLVQTLESRGFYHTWGHWNPSSRTMALGSTQYRETGAQGWPRRHVWTDCQVNMGASTAHNLMGLQSLFTGG